MSRSKHAGEVQRVLLTGALVLALVMPVTGFAQEPDSAAPTDADASKVQGPGLKGEPLGQSSSTAAHPASSSEKPKPVLDWETGAGKSYVIPGLEIVGYLFLLNQFDRHFVEPKSVYREFYVTGLLSPEPQGYENILRGDASLTLRIYDRHGVALRYVSSHRDARYPNVEFRDQTVGTLSLMYVFLGTTKFGAVEWR